MINESISAAEKHLDGYAPVELQSGTVLHALHGLLMHSRAQEAALARASEVDAVQSAHGTVVNARVSREHKARAAAYAAAIAPVPAVSHLSAPALSEA